MYPSCFIALFEVYPRTCGGTASHPLSACLGPGLSPHVRGNRGGKPSEEPLRGSIPARAGEPFDFAFSIASLRVYPRTCGGTACTNVLPLSHVGLSPHVRGNRECAPFRFYCPGSIPARAGEPRRTTCVHTVPWVYPRTCGGTAVSVRSAGAATGLSPHVRGNPPSTAPGPIPDGSIPARAGEPCVRVRDWYRTRVYPRTCGGTASAPSRRRSGWGLSPHVRGNRCRACTFAPYPGSIPARAGEPLLDFGHYSSFRVYPRTCGGTPDASSTNASGGGLSPHVRGNPRRGNQALGPRGSIPARAGEPGRGGRPGGRPGVYPRTCGGTCAREARSGPSSGLSPHVRGNLGVGVGLPSDGGSIPARAGEPDAAPRTRTGPGVYPRTCGGTVMSMPIHWRLRGLSPHVRGNRVELLREVLDFGSIPARAGEPWVRALTIRIPAVYPRTCGGTV